MPNTVAVADTGFVGVDSLLSGVKWNTLALTYSFPDFTTLYPLSYGEPFNNFEPFNAAQRAAVLAVYRQISSFTNLSFSQAGAPGSGDLRFAMTDYHANAFGYYPNPNEKGGDSWYNNSGRAYDDPRVAQYGFASLIHEIGHTLGLSHPHDETPVMPADRDSLEFTAMSYRSYVGQQALGRFTNETNGYPQTYMMFDIYALQHMYGANYGYNAGDTVYRWDPATGAFSVNGAVQWTPAGNRIFMTLWDGNGNDTYDLSNFTNAMALDLRPGSSTDTSPVQHANLGDGQVARGNVFNAFLFNGDTRSLIENAIGGSGNDDIIGNEGPNRLDGRGGNDIVSGEAGTDTLIGGTGADAMDGGTGNDTYYVDNPGDKVTELSGEGTDRVVSSISLTLPSHVEELVLAGTDPLSGTGNGLANLLIGNAAGNALSGGSGADMLDGRAGGDTMTGGTGNDVYIVDSAGDGVVETSSTGGTDTVRSAVSYTLGSFVEQLVLTGSAAINGTGNAGANRITGNGAANVLNGAAGADTMTGGSGGDTYVVDNKDDKTVESSAAGGSDKVLSSISFTLPANVEHLVLTGSAAANGAGNGLGNSLAGNGAANILKGAAGNDTLSGGSGDDLLYGGAGKDTLKGDAGRDGFYFDAPLSSSTNVDRLDAFAKADDTIFLSRSIFTALAGGTLTTAAFRAGTAAADSSDRIVYDKAAGQIFYDPDGNGAAAQILFATVAPGTAISNLDFVAYI